MTSEILGPDGKPVRGDKPHGLKIPKSGPGLQALGIGLVEQVANLPDFGKAVTEIHDSLKARGDKPDRGTRATLTVLTMLSRWQTEARSLADDLGIERAPLTARERRTGAEAPPVNTGAPDLALP